MGGLQAKSMTSQRNRAITRWRICVTMTTLWQQQDGGYVLLWQRYDNNNMADMCYYGNVMTTTRWRKQVQSMTVYDSLWLYCWRCRIHLEQVQSMTVVLLLDVYTELVIDVFYIFNSTLIDWTCYMYFPRVLESVSGSYPGDFMSGFTLDEVALEKAILRLSWTYCSITINGPR